MSEKNELENLSVCVLLPISELESSVNKKANPFHVGYECAIDSVCFSKPFVYYTIKEIEK